MNDCVWCFLFCESACKCEKYLSVNSKEGFTIMKEYEAEIEPLIQQVINPVVDKYKKKFEEYGEVN